MQLDKRMILDALALFEFLDESQIKELEKMSIIKSYKKGATLFLEGDTPKELLIVARGRLKVYKTDLKFNEIVLHQFTPTQMVAEMPLFEGVPYPASASFETDGAILHINFETFKKAFFSQSEIAFSFVRSLSKKIKNLEMLINRTMVLDATARVAHYIYEHESELQNVKHKELAQLLHIKAETLSRVLKKLSQMQLIEKSGKFYQVKNAQGLKALFELEED